MLIVDVFNVLHAASKGHPSVRAASPQRLFDLIQASRFRSMQAWLVCDGTAGGLAHAPDRPSGFSDAPGPRLLFAGPGQDADALIEALLDRLEHARRAHTALVISSDRRLQQAAIGARARWARSEAFLELLAEDVRRAADHERGRTGGRPAFGVRDQLDPAEVAHWLSTFGVADGSSTPAPPLHQPSTSLDASQLDAAMLAELEDWARTLDSVDPPSRSEDPPDTTRQRRE